MLLSENTEVINELKIILKAYDFLKYDESRSEGENYLQVKVIDLTANRSKDIIYQIHIRLEQATGEKFRIPNPIGYGRGYSDWPYFRIKR